MARFRLSGPLAVPAFLCKPIYSAAYAVNKKTYGPGERININFKSYGGTEVAVNGLLGVENTAIVETWYRPDITSDCRLVVNGVNYEVLGQPEDIEMRHQYLRFRVKAIKGGP